MYFDVELHKSHKAMALVQFMLSVVYIAYNELLPSIHGQPIFDWHWNCLTQRMETGLDKGSPACQQQKLCLQVD